MKKLSKLFIFSLLVIPFIVGAQSITLEEFNKITGADSLTTPPDPSQAPSAITSQNNQVTPETAAGLQAIQNAYDGLINDAGLPQGYEAQVAIKLNPEIPGPGDFVSAYLNTSTVKLSDASITWILNGKTISSGTGKKSVGFTAPDSGDSLTLTANITTSGGNFITKKVSFALANVDLFYEAQTFTPPFYKGRALYTDQSSIRVVAIPEFYSAGKKIPNSQLNFEWRKNGTVAKDQSGVGNDVFRYTDSILENSAEIEVIVKNLSGSTVATEEIRLAPTSVKNFVYELNPLYGPIFENALSNEFTLNRDEVELINIPFFYTANNASDFNIKNTWRINGDLVKGLSPYSNKIVLRNEEGETGKANVSISTSSTENLTQKSSESITLIFEDLSNSGFRF